MQAALTAHAEHLADFATRIDNMLSDATHTEESLLEIVNTSGDSNGMQCRRPGSNQLHQPMVANMYT